MPLYKYYANRLLTLVQNLLMGSKLSEFHTGYRAFSRKVLEELPLEENSDDFVFDNQMLAQVIAFGLRIGEISCPTRYFAEASSIGFRSLGDLRAGRARDRRALPPPPMGTPPRSALRRGRPANRPGSRPRSPRGGPGPGRRRGVPRDCPRWDNLSRSRSHKSPDDRSTVPEPLPRSTAVRPGRDEAEHARQSTWRPVASLAKRDDVHTLASGPRTISSDSPGT